MNNPVSRSLVPVIRNLPALITGGDRRAKQEQEKKAAQKDFDLVRHETHLRDSEEVEKFLPDILGRALARIWIDPQFRDRFAAGPVETLASYGVHLPRSIKIEFVTEGAPRPQIVVYEQRNARAARKRLLSLRLTMLAGR